MIIINPYRFTSAASTLLTGLTASYSLNGNALKNVGTNDGTDTNVTYGTGKFGQGAIYNGTGYTSVSDSADFTLGANDWAFSFWVKRGTTGSTQLFFGQANAAGTNAGTSIGLRFTATNTIGFTYIDNALGGSTTDTGVSITDTTTWHNIIIMRDGNAFKLYLDATLSYNNASLLSGITINDATTNFSFGRQGQYPSLFLNGMMDEINIWKARKLTSSEITELQTKAYPFT